MVSLYGINFINFMVLTSTTTSHCKRSPLAGYPQVCDLPPSPRRALGDGVSLIDDLGVLQVER